LVALAAIFSAIADILENENFLNSKLKRLNPKFWYKRESWKYAKKVFNYKVDGWHLCKSAMIILLVWKASDSLLEFVVLGAIWNAAFGVMYYFLDGDK
jgi:hypothetical protein